MFLTFSKRKDEIFIKIFKPALTAVLLYTFHPLECQGEIWLLPKKFSGRTTLPPLEPIALHRPRDRAGG